MKILIVNDDGFYADGVKAIVDVLKDRHRVYVVAPRQHMSGMGHAITVGRPIEVQKMSFAGTVEAYQIDGTPTDCVKIACRYLFVDDAFDLVVSGINNGANLGSDVLFSGTVSAAHQAWRFGKRALALSATNRDRSKPMIFKYAAEHAARFIDALDLSAERFLYSINYPYNCKPKGLKLATLSDVRYKEKISLSGNDNRFSVTFIGHPVNYSTAEDNEYDLIARGYATIYPLNYEIYDSRCDVNIKALND